MKQEQVLSLVRHILSGIGGVLIAKGVVNESIVLDVTGTILALVSVGWSVFNKTFAVNQIEGVARQVLTTLGLFIAFLNPTVVEQIIGFATGILSIVLGQTSKVKDVPEGEENK